MVLGLVYCILVVGGCIWVQWIIADQPVHRGYKIYGVIIWFKKKLRSYKQHKKVFKKQTKIVSFKIYTELNQFSKWCSTMWHDWTFAISGILQWIQCWPVDEGIQWLLIHSKVLQAVKLDHWSVVCLDQHAVFRWENALQPNWHHTESDLVPLEYYISHIYVITYISYHNHTAWRRYDKHQA